MTLKIDPRPQWHALAWLRETGEHRPALDVLASDDRLSPEFRRELARWIAGGCKRRKGSAVPSDPWLEFPPKLARSLGLCQTPREELAWLIFASFSSVQARGVRTTSNGGGRPRTMETEACALVAHKLGVTERTARKWLRAWWPLGIFRNE